MSFGLAQGGTRLVAGDLVNMGASAQQIGHLAHAQAELLCVESAGKPNADGRHSARSGIVTRKYRASADQCVQP
ncbi:hypothetical protein BURK_003807 [Burkholderia sp. SJ98]|nr:hypothetical protein BURK_003807 [Burkholderia sp. SJ98]